MEFTSQPGEPFVMKRVKSTPVQRLIAARHPSSTFSNDINIAMKPNLTGEIAQVASVGWVNK